MQFPFLVLPSSLQKKSEFFFKGRKLQRAEHVAWKNESKADLALRTASLVGR
jgi:hypothetical protein